jgi:integrase
LVDDWLEEKMAGTIREARLGSPTARSRLARGRQPHWNTLIAGRAHLGWQRWPDDKTGRWILRRRTGAAYRVEQLALADDGAADDGVGVLSYEQAKETATARLASESAPVGRITVCKAIADYIDHLAGLGKDTRNLESSAVVHILPKLGDVDVASLTSKQLRSWLTALAAAPARKRPKQGRQMFKAAPVGDEEIRRRRASANRVLTHLKAALNHAFDERRVASNDAWGRRVKKFRGVDAARARYLTVAEANRLINASDPGFRPLVRAALETGMRYSELARLEVSDFNPVAGTIAVRRSKSGRARHVVVTLDGVEFFRQHCAGRGGGDLMFARPDGEPWRRSNAEQPIVEACKRASISPPIGFHGLRHTWASLAVMNGVPLMVVARNLGHRDTSMVEKHYGHLAPSYVTDAIRAGAPRFAIGGQSNIRPLR